MQTLRVPSLLAGACTDADHAVLLEPQPASAQTTPAATIFAEGTISDSRWQYRLTFTPDGKTAYYTVSENFFPATRQGTIIHGR